jgi:hypothetical protein
MIAGAITYDRFQPAAITLGPATTLYFREPGLATRVHEAIHRRQMRDKTTLGRLVSAVRYPFDYRFRLDEEISFSELLKALQFRRSGSPQHRIPFH